MLISRMVLMLALRKLSPSTLRLSIGLKAGSSLRSPSRKPGFIGRSIIAAHQSSRPLSYKHDTKLLVLALEKLKEAYSVKGTDYVNRCFFNF